MPEPDELWKDVTRMPARLRTAPRRKRSSGFLAAALIVGCILAAAGGLLYWQTQAGRKPESLAVAPPADDTTAPTGAAPKANNESNSEPPQPAASPALRSVPTPTRPVSAPLPAAEAPSPSPTQKTPSPATPRQSPPAETAKPPSPAPAPKPVKPRSPAADPADLAQRGAAFDRAVNQARAALVARDLQEADRRLDAAEANVRLPEQLEQVQRLRALSVQLRLFFDAVKRGLRKYQATEEIDIDGLIAAIIEVGPDRVTLFIEGSKRNFTIATMPAPMALFFARSAANEKSPVAAAFFGAFHAVDPQGDREQARALWRTAAAGDVPVEDLLPLLDGPPLASRRQPVPDAELVNAATIRVQGPLSELIVKAESGPRKALVATKFLDAARRVDNSPEQYAALEQARDWAVSAGDPVTVLAALDELDRWFEVDGLELKSKALGAALSGRVTSKSAILAATAAFDLSVEAERAGRDELALTLADIAYQAARKTRESELVKRAYRLRSELTEKIKSGSRSRRSNSAPAKR